MIVGIDPGTKAVGVGVLDGIGQLTGARLVRGTTPDGLAIDALAFVIDLRRTGGEVGEPLRVIIEYPQAYLPGQQKGDQNDLIRVALVAGACGAAIKSRFDHAQIEFVLPRVWKGTVDPDVFTNRIERRLSSQEVSRIEPCPNALQHNVLDGIGLALFAVGRMDRIRVYD